ncbi:DUF5305 domain-containing protein [Halohasta salina]|uniref:DUF5305 domain-containing protein n=1 Tax=Halohasta salina TaxID=2961621 RepID=UPI0020A39301|nr:DUF5305 domain-containing protein [Halohasta salina]
MVDWQLRLRAVLDKQFTIVLGVLVVIALLGGWLTYTAHAAPEPTTEQRVTAWEVSGNFTHSATVETDNSLYEQGRTLTDRPIYFTRLSPVLQGTFATSYTVRDSGSLSQTVSLSLVMRNVDQDDGSDSQTVYWQRTEPLDSTTVESVDPGEQVRVSFAQDMSDVRAEIERIREEVGGSPGQTEVLVRATVRSDGTVNGNTVDETDVFTLPIVFDGGGYRISGAGPTVESYETSRTVPATQPGGPLQTLGGPVLLLVALGSIGAVTASREDLSEADRELMAYEDDREAFDEWISTIELPAAAFDRPQAEAASLGALVDFAIDTNNSVIEDPDEERYYVLHNDYIYTYRPSKTVSQPSNGEHSADDRADTAAEPENHEE